MGDAVATEKPAIELDDLHKRYPNGVQALRGVSLTISRGEVFGLIGPNGAGKSTLLKVMAGLLKPEQGRVVMEGRVVTGQPIEAAREAGFMPDPLGVYTDLTSREYLEFFGRLAGLGEADRRERIDETVELLGLAPWLDSEVESLSAGWQRRLALGRVLMGRTPVLLLDEPAAGLDVAARGDLLETVRKLAETGRTIVISSHILPELEQLADRFGVMAKGRWAEMGPGMTFFNREDLRHGMGDAGWIMRGGPVETAEAILSRAGAAWRRAGEALEFQADEERSATLLTELVRGGVRIEEFRRRETGLSEAVLRVLKAGEGKA